MFTPPSGWSGALRLSQCASSLPSVEDSGASNLKMRLLDDQPIGGAAVAAVMVTLLTALWLGGSL